MKDSRMTEETEKKTLDEAAPAAAPAASSETGASPDVPKTAPEQQSADKADAKDSEQARPSLKTQVVLKKRYRLYPMRPMPSLDMPTAKAYTAEDLKDPKRKIYALVVPPDVPIYYENAAKIAQISSPSLLPFVDMGTVFWQPYSQKTKVVLYEQPLGGRVMASDTTTCLPFNEADLIANVLPSFVSVIELFASKELTHRAIRPSNMYYMDAEKKQIVLGDCITVPPAYEQSEVFETIPSAMCAPEGRGKGTTANDLYALAVSAVFLALGHNPMGNDTPREVLQAKLKKGSYGALLEGQKVYLSLIELARGLLSDDPRYSWDLKNTKAWFESANKSQQGFRLDAKKNSQRPFVFNGEEFFSYRALAYAFVEHWDKAAEAICSDKLIAWIERGFNDTALAEKIKHVVTAGRDDLTMMTPEQENFIITKVCMLLDMRAPLRTYSYRLMPDGLGYMLAMHSLQKKDTSKLFSLISDGYLEMWYSVREDKVSGQYIKNLKKILVSRELGMGRERCLYELNDGLPCLSPILTREYIDDMAEILPALESVSKSADQRTWPLDRHIIAYVATHCGGKIGNQLMQINRQRPDQSASGMLNLLGALQWMFGPEVLYGLTSWVGSLVAPIVNSYHSKATQARMQKDLPKLVRKGNITALARYLDSADARTEDVTGFDAAKKQYVALAEEIAYLEDNKEERLEYYKTLGYQVAAIISSSLAILTMFFLLLHRFLRG